MFFYALCVVVMGLGLWGIVAIWMDSTTTNGERAGSLILLPLVVGFGFLLALLVAMIPANIDGTEPEYDYSFNLQAIKAGEQTSGSMFLGTGYISGDMVYRFYIKNDNGTFSPSYIYANDATIVESDDSEPHVDVWDYNFKHLYVPRSLPMWGETTEGSKYVITVPKGSITPQIDMDLP